MDISELNQYLLKEITPATLMDEEAMSTRNPFYSYCRNGAAYCYTSLINILQRQTSDAVFRQLLLDEAAKTYIIREHEEGNAGQIANNTYEKLREEGCTDYCEQEDVSLHMGFLCYVHCLAYNTKKYKQIFLLSWNKYFSLEFQNKIRGTHYNEISYDLFITSQDILYFLREFSGQNVIAASYKYQLQKSVPPYLSQDKYLERLFIRAKQIFDSTNKTKEDLIIILFAVKAAHCEHGGVVSPLWTGELSSWANRILAC